MIPAGNKQDSSKSISTQVQIDDSPRTGDEMYDMASVLPTPGREILMA